MGELNGDLITWATGITEVVNTRRMQGRLHEANETCRHALQKMTDQGVFQFGSLAKLEVALAEVLCEQNELEEAYRRVTGVMARMQAWTMPTDRIFAGLVLIHVQMAQGNYTDAFKTLHEAKELKTAFPVLMPLACLVDQDEIRLFLVTGDISTAGRLVTELQPGANRVASLREQELLLLVRVRLAQGEVEEAGQILDSLADSKGETERLGYRLEKLVLRVLLLNQCGEQAAAAALLLEALGLAEPEGFMRVFVNEGETMRSLLAVAAGRAPVSLSAYIQKLLDAFSGEPELFQIQEKNADLVEPLTERELEVLGLIAEGLKYEEIAERLFISVNTVRTYVKAIYGKLNVNNRSKAVAAAHQLKIL
jgi:LuxR family maltose regulon positive regulatory protein